MAARAILGAAGGSAGADKLYVDDVFSTYLYSGSGTSSNSVTNGIDLAGKGGLVWCKTRGVSEVHVLCDTARGVNKRLFANTTDGEDSGPGITAFNANGFSINTTNAPNSSTYSYTSWTFRRAPKFFDVVTYTGDAVPGRQIAHSLGQAPGMIIIKNTNVAREWAVWHRSLADATYLKLNTTDAAITNNTFNVFGDASGQTSSVFTVGKVGASGVNGLTNANASSETYVAYLFAHDTGTDGIIQCGSYVGNGVADGPSVTLGWEPQFVLIKEATGASTGSWFITDSMRGMPVGSAEPYLTANTADFEYTTEYVSPTATGFKLTIAGTSSVNTNGRTYIYLAIRRPNKPPTSGTEVYNAIKATLAIGTQRTVGFPADLIIGKAVSTVDYLNFNDRLRGFLSSNTTGSAGLDPTSTSAESTGQYPLSYDVWNTTAKDGGYMGVGTNRLWYFFRRAPGVFDVVCYTGIGDQQTISHSLGVTPEFIIVKERNNAAYGWVCYHTATGTKATYLNTTADGNGSENRWGTMTSTTFQTGPQYAYNSNSYNYVAYLFATKPGISKVGSYTGNGGTVNTNGTSQTINCGFTTGARFVLIKRTDSTGDWFVFDTARGLVAGNDPYLLLNSTAAEVTTVDAVDPSSVGFDVVQTSGTNLNVTNASYIFLAIA